MDMKKTDAPQEAKYFKFKFTPAMLILAYSVIALCIIGIILSAIRIYTFGIHDFNDMLKSPFLILVCVFGIVVVISMLVCSRYIVTNEEFVSQFGLIKSRFHTKSFTSVLLDTDTHKLTIYMKEEFFVVTTNPEWNNDLVQALREVNPDLEFSFTLAENKEQKK